MREHIGTLEWLEGLLAVRRIRRSGRCRAKDARALGLHVVRREMMYYVATLEDLEAETDGNNQALGYTTSHDAYASITNAVLRGWITGRAD